MGHPSHPDDSNASRLPFGQRDALIDLLRSGALIRIIVWHLFAQNWMTWIAALPVMFFVLGTVTRPSPNGYLRFVRRRARRLLVPFWVYGVSMAGFSAVAVIAGSAARTDDVSLTHALAWVLPLVDPVAMSWTGGWLSTHLWYLRAVLWITLLTPLLRVAARHIQRTAVAGASGIALLALASARNIPYLGSGGIHVLIGDVLVYGFFAVLGIAYSSNNVFTSVQTRRNLAIGSWAGAALFAVLLGVPAGGVNGSYPLIALVGFATLCSLSLIEVPLRSLANRPNVKAATRRVSGRALTIYLWHPLCIVGATRLVASTGPLALIGRLAVTVLLVGLVVCAVGRVEDLAGSKRPRQAAPLRRSRNVGIGLAAAVFAAFSMSQGSWVSAEAFRTLNSGTLIPNIPAPSSRLALSDEAFAATTTRRPYGDATVEEPRPSELAESQLEFATLLSFEPTTNAPRTVPVSVRMSRLPSVTTASRGRSKSPTTRAAARQPVPTTVVRSPNVSTRTKAAVATTALQPTRSVTVAPASAEELTTAGVTSTTPPTSQNASLPADKLQRAFDAWRAQAQPAISSSVVAVRIGNATWTSRSADPGVSSKYLTTSEFRASSITKTFTAALVLRAIDRGLLTLDDQVASISSVTIPAPTGLTVARLLTHTSGLVDYRSAPGYDAAAPLSVTDAVSLSLRAPIIPGAPTQASYANSNYLYLGMLLEQVEGKPFSQLIRELITPLGLTDTRLDEVPQPGWVGFSSGGVMSTTSDLARWGQALLTPGRVLSKKALSTMTTINDANVGFGLWPACPCGTDAQGVKTFTAIGHHTADGGMFNFPATGMTVVAMFEPTGHDTHARIVSLAAAFDVALL